MGLLTARQWTALAPYVAGKTVEDLGAGGWDLALQLLEMGASRVIAVDCCFRSDFLGDAPERIDVLGRYFQEHLGSSVAPDVAFASWPDMYKSKGLEALMRRAPVAVYLGTNMDGVACGRRELFEHLVQRRVLAHVPASLNTLIVYGDVMGERRPLPEEHAALSRDTSPIVWSRSVYFELDET